jgi:anti-sigma factor RsiW
MNAPLCHSLRSHFDDYHDGLLAPARAEVLRSHLSTCDTCREEYGLLVSCIGVIRGLDAPAVPPQTLRKIVDTLSDSDPSPSLPDRLLGPDFEQGLEPS